jgi:hypothetical protein
MAWLLLKLVMGTKNTKQNRKKKKKKKKKKVHKSKIKWGGEGSGPLNVMPPKLTPANLAGLLAITLVRPSCGQMRNRPSKHIQS